MRARPLCLGLLLAALALLADRDVRAESQAAVDKIVALNKTAITAFTAGDHEKAKAELMEAVVLGKENGLGMHAAMARTYVHLGVVYVDGFKDREKGIRYFQMAQKVRPDIELTPALASKTVVAAFDAAKGAKPEAPKSETAKAEPPKKEASAKAETPKTAEPKTAEKAKASEANAQAREEADKATKQLAETRATADKDRAEKERLQKQLAEKDKLLGEKDKLLGEKDKLLADKDKLLADKDKQLADAKASAKKEQEARQQLEKSKQESAKAIADVKANEQKEREALQKLEKERQLADQQEKDRKARETQERAAHEKLVEGPDLPTSIPRPLYCPGLDEGILNADLYVHCAPQAQVKAKALVFYYRQSGVAHFDAVSMSRSKKGWWTAIVPAARMTGKTLQFYVEARGPKDDVTATEGKSDSPNILPLKTASEAVAKTDPAALDKAPAKPAAKKTAAHQKVKARH